jgi:hypothetical protein
MRPSCIDIIIARDIGLMNRLPRKIPVEANRERTFINTCLLDFEKQEVFA